MVAFKSKLGFKLLLTATLVMMAAISAFSGFAIYQVIQFGDDSARRNEAAILNKTHTFLTRLTKERALGYDRTFKRLYHGSAFIADKLTRLLNENPETINTAARSRQGLIFHKDNAIWSNASTENTMVLYWGARDLSDETAGRIHYLSNIDPVLESVKESNKESIAGFIVTRDGIARYYPNVHAIEQLPHVSDYDIRTASWYTQAGPDKNPEKKTKWTSIYKDSVGNGLMITASTPVYDKKGRFLGACGIDITLEQITREITGEKGSDQSIYGMFCFMVNEKGNIIAHCPSFGTILGYTPDETVLHNPSIVLKYSLFDSPKEKVRMMGKTILEKASATFRFQLDNKSYLVSSQTMPSTGWRLGIMVPESTVTDVILENKKILSSMIKKMGIRFALSSLVFITLSIFILSLFFITRLIKPLNRLTSWAREIEEGNLDVQVELASDDEMGKLAASFDSMARALKKNRDMEKQYQQTLEQKVEQQTREVKQQNRALEHTLAELETIFNNTQVGIGLFTGGNQIVRANEKFAAILGYETPGEINGISVDHFFPTDEKASDFHDRFYAPIEKGVQAGIEYALHKKSGKPVWCSISGKAVDRTVPPNLDKGVIWILEDISIKKQSQQALKDSKNRFKEMADLLPGAICEMDTRLKVTYVNTLGLKSFGITKADFEKGIISTDVIHPEDHEKAIETLAKVAQGMDIGAGDYRLVKPDGTIMHVLIHASAIHKNGELAGYRCSITDISELKILQEKLMKAQKTESISVFAGGIAHDFNNLLSIILGYINMVEMDVPKDTEAHTFLSESVKAVIRAKDLTNRMLTLSKSTDAVKSRTSTRSLIHKITAPIIEEGRIQCDIDILDQIPDVFIDREQIKNVIENILTNAIEASASGTPIRIRVENFDYHEDDPLPLKHGPYVKISVSDKGTGISNKNIKKIFDPYFSTKEMGARKGIGLSLATCYAIVEKHGGTIDVHSGKWVGSTFTIYLPSHERHPAVKPIPKHPKSVSAVPKTGRILLMDDEKMIRDIARHMFSRLGYVCECAREGTRAIGMYSRALKEGKPYELVILDLTIKEGLGGRDTIAELLKLDPDIKAVVSSGYYDNPVMKAPDRYGFSDVLVKPYTLETVVELLNAMGMQAD